MVESSEEPRGRKFSPGHAAAWEKMLLTTARLIRAVEEGCITLKESAVVDGRLFIYHRVGRYTMIEPTGRMIGIVDNTKGEGYVNGILHDNVYKFTAAMEDWLRDQD